MPRNTARKIDTDPNLVHVNVRRNFAGSVQMAAASTASFSSISGTSAALTFTDLLAFTSATLKVTSTSGSPTSAKLLRNGASVTTITGGITPNSTSSTTQNTHTTPLNAPTYTISAVGGTVTGTVSVAREQRWA